MLVKPSIWTSKCTKTDPTFAFDALVSYIEDFPPAQLFHSTFIIQHSSDFHWLLNSEDSLKSSFFSKHELFLQKICSRNVNVIFLKVECSLFTKFLVTRLVWQHITPVTNILFLLYNLIFRLNSKLITHWHKVKYCSMVKITLNFSVTSDNWCPQHGLPTGLVSTWLSLNYLIPVFMSDYADVWCMLSYFLNEHHTDSMQYKQGQP